MASAAAACAVPVLVGFVIPCDVLVREVIRRDLVADAPPDFARHFATTLALAAVAATMVVAWAIAITTAARAGSGRLPRLLGLLTGLGYAVPGTVLVLGLLGALVATDRAFGTLVAAVTGREPGLLQIGSGAALVTA